MKLMFGTNKHCLFSVRINQEVQKSSNTGSGGKNSGICDLFGVSGVPTLVIVHPQGESNQ